MHPVLEQQRVMEGGGYSTQGMGPPVEDGFIADLNNKTPNVLAAMALGSIATLVVLRALGFRFSFGVNVGGGS